MLVNIFIWFLGPSHFKTSPGNWWSSFFFRKMLSQFCFYIKHFRILFSLSLSLFLKTKRKHFQWLVINDKFKKRKRSQYFQTHKIYLLLSSKESEGKLDGNFRCQVNTVLHVRRLIVQCCNLIYLNCVDSILCYFHNLRLVFHHSWQQTSVSVVFFLKMSMFPSQKYECLSERKIWIASFQQLKSEATN